MKKGYLKVILILVLILTIPNKIFAYNISKVYDKTEEKTISMDDELTLPILEDEYMTEKSKGVDIYSVAVIIISLLCVLIVDRWWIKNRKNVKYTETLEYYPPKNYNPSEVSFLYNGYVTGEDVTSLLLYLANQGYLRIEEMEYTEKDNGFKIIKLKEYDGNNENERIFLGNLFKERKNVIYDKIKRIKEETRENGKKLGNDEITKIAEEQSRKTEVTGHDLYNSFYLTTYTIIKKLENKENKNKVFETKMCMKIKWIVFVIISIITLISMKPIIENVAPETSGLIFCYIFGIFSLIRTSLKDNTIQAKIAGIIITIIFLGSSFIGLILPSLMQDTMYLITYIVGGVSIAVVILFAKTMQKRTPYGNEMLVKINGFKKFMKMKENSKLNQLMQENPEYLYDILPYAYTLGLTEIWIKKAKAMGINPPNWYSSNKGFYMSNFEKFMSQKLKTINYVMNVDLSSTVN